MGHVHNDYQPRLEGSESDNSAGEAILRLVAALTLLFAAAHLAAAFLPSSSNWGVHHLAFFPLLVRVAAPLLMIAVLFPVSRKYCLHIIHRLSQYLRSMRKVHRMLLALAGLMVCGVAFWAARERTYFLGDGFMILGWLRITDSVRQIPLLFKHEPLVGLIAWRLYSLFIGWNVPSASEFVFQTISVMFGLGSVVMMVALSCQLFAEDAERVLFTLLLLVSGASQLFFGYVENYTPAYFGLLAFVFLALRCLRGRIPLLVPSIAFGILITLDFGMLAFLPLLLLLFYQALRSGRFGTFAVSFLMTPLTSAVILWSCGYSLPAFVETVFHGEGHLVPLLRPSGGWKVYTMFSLPHAQEVANLYLLLLPFTPLLLVAVAIAFRRKISVRSPEQAFMLLLGALGILFTLMFNTDIGMSRDWDLMAPFYLGATITAGWLLGTFVGQPLRRNIFAVMIIAMCLHTVPWILVNADTERSLARFNILPDERLWGPNAFKVYEELGVYYREKKDTLKSIEYYERCVRYDSLNSRILGNLSEMYRLTGKEDVGIGYAEKAMRLGTKMPGIYHQSGIYYAKHGRFDEAITLMKRSLDLKPNDATVSMNIGTLLMKIKSDFGSALRYFVYTIRLDSSFADAYLNAGNCLVKLNEPDSARSYIDHYLLLNPGDPNKETIEKLVRR